MSKGNGRFEELTRQNELLKEQNNLLREQNDLLRQTASLPANDNHEIFIENIDRDEMRNGFLVSSHKKKLWNVQIGLINEFARVCKKHNLRWFAFYGTLLGAARHKGFIPWDDDSDVVMFRDDYEKFKRIARTEIKPPYFVDDWSDYRREDSENTFEDSEMHLPLITREQERHVGWPFCYPQLKLRDSRTAMIAYPNRPDVNQGIFIDVFPLDAAPPFTDKSQQPKFNAARLLLQTIAFPDDVRKLLAKNTRLIIPAEQLKNFLKQSHKRKVAILENFLRKNFSAPEHVDQLRDWSLIANRYSYDTADFNDVVYLPFEKIKVPAPVGWEKILTTRYGDWQKMIYTHTHSLTNSADVSYDEYFSHAAKKTVMTDENSVTTVLIEDVNGGGQV